MDESSHCERAIWHWVDRLGLLSDTPGMLREGGLMDIGTTSEPFQAYLSSDGGWWGRSALSAAVHQQKEPRGGLICTTDLLTNIFILLDMPVESANPFRPIF